MTILNKYIPLLLLLSLLACAPYIEDKTDIGPTPTASFEIIAGDTPNDFICKNTTEGAFLTYWDFGNYGNKEGQEVDLRIPHKGEYDISMTTFNRGGSASSTKTVTVTEDDPGACFGNLLLLTNCTEKTWKLAPEAAAMHIGPSISETWWGNSEQDIIDRDCHFNDRYTFRINGEFEFDSNGDLYADSDDNDNVWPSDLAIEVGCHNSDEWPSDFSAWDSGLHQYEIDNSSLTVKGNGAWIGLYKIGTTEEVTVPQDSVTYTLNSITEDRMILVADYGWGVWRVTLVSE